MLRLSEIETGKPQLGTGLRSPSLQTRRRKLAMGLAVLLSGGSLLQTCETRVRDAFVGGAKDVLFNTILTPAVFADLLNLNQDAAGG